MRDTGATERRNLRRERIREKVAQWLKDVWRPYHGSTAHVEDSDGIQIIEKKKKSGGHMPLNAAVMALSDPKKDKDRKLKAARDLMAGELYRLACGSAAEVVIFSEIQDLYRDYGAGDSDIDDLRAKAREHGAHSESAAKLNAVEFGIDLITDRLIAAGISERDFWADFPMEKLPRSGVRSERAENKDERYRRYYLAFLEEGGRIEAAKREQYRKAGKKPPENIRVRNKAARNVAASEGVTERTVWEAVGQCESGYVDLSEDPEKEG